MKAFTKIVIRQISGSLSRYISIFAIIALGVGFFAGLRASSPAMSASADAYFDEQRLSSFRLLSTWGFDETDISELSERLEAQGREFEIYPSQFTDLTIITDDARSVARVHSWDAEQDVNIPVLSAGRFPSSPDECLVDDSPYSGSLLGSVITLYGDDDSAPDNLDRNSFTVVGTVHSPLYVSLAQYGNTNVGTGTISHYILIPSENFNTGYYTELYIYYPELAALASYSDEYDELSGEIAGELETIADAGAEARFSREYSSVADEIADARAELEDGRRELEENRAKLEDGRRELEDSKNTLADAEREISGGEQELIDARRTLEDSRQEIDDGYALLREGEAEYEKNLAELEGSRAELDAARARLDSAAEELAAGEQAIAAAKAELDSSRSELEAKEDEYSAALAQYNENLANYEAAILIYGEAALAEQKAQLDAAAASLAAGRAELDAGWSALAAGEDELEAQEAQLEAARSEIESGEQEYSAGLAAYNEGAAQLAAARDTLDENARELADAEAQLADAERDIRDGEEELAAARSEYEDGLREYADGEQELLDGEREIADAEQEIRDGEQEIADAERELNDLEAPDWLVYDRDSFPAYTEYGQNSERIRNISIVFPAFFLAVAALVSLTTMTRMVDEERTQTGVLVALGYTNGRIVFKYMVYALSATLLGAVFGITAGFQIFPRIIIRCYGVLYRVGDPITPFRWNIAVPSVLAALAVVSVTVFAACHADSKAHPALLMRPKAPPNGKRVIFERIPFLWNRLSFTAKVAMRNIARYKKRMIMTVVGVAGCTTLIVAGFGLRDSIDEIVTTQYGTIWKYNALAVLDPDKDVSAEELGEVARGFDENSRSLPVLQMSCTSSGEDGSISTYLLVAEDSDALSGFVDLHERVSRRSHELPLDGDGCVITEKLSKLTGAKVGDTLKIDDGAGGIFSVTVSAIVENYMYHYVYMSRPCYEYASGETFEPNSVILTYSLDRAQEDELSEALLDSGALGLRLSSQLQDTINDVLGVFIVIIIVLIVSAGLLAFVVLYNLTNINITERIREIATLKVLGFYDREVSMYIFHENIVLTILGAALGLLTGWMLAIFVISSAEIDMLMFGRNVRPLSFVISAALTCAFSLVVSLAMHRRLRKVNMAESLKSVE